MKMYLSLLTFGFFAAVYSFAGNSINDGKKYIVMELYSWKDKSGAWHFSMLPTKSSLYTEEYICDSKSAIPGVGALKDAIARQPPGTELIWGVEFAKSSSVSRLEYPNRRTILEIARFVVAKRLKLTVIGNQSTVPFEKFAPNE